VSRDGRPRALLSRLWYGFDGLAGDTLWSGLHDAIALLTALTSFKLVTTALDDTARYGAYVGIYGLLGAVGAFSYSGVGLALLQRLVGERDDPSRALRSFFSLALSVGMVLGVLSIVLAVTRLGLTIAEAATIVAAELLGTAVASISSVLVQASSGFGAAVRVRLGLVLIRLAVVVVLYAAGNLTVVHLGASILASFGVYGLYLLVVHLPRHGYRVTFGRPTAGSVKASWLFSVPMGAAKIQTDGDKFLLAAWGFKAEAGLYGAAYRILLLGIMPLMALDAAAFQRFLPREPGRRGIHWYRATRLAALTASASVVVAIGLYVVARPLLNILVEPKYREAIDIVPWLLPLVPLISTSGTPLNGLLGLGRATQRMYVYLVSAFVSVIAYLLLIPRFDWRGAVIATYISEVFLALTGWAALWYFQRQADRTVDADPIMTSA
jgi:O-antigen/teichoic acid export membrane protein